LPWGSPAGPATAGDEIPFEASGLRYHVSVEKVPTGSDIVVAVPDGESNFGDWEGLAQVHVVGNHLSGTLTIAFEPGNTLTVEFEQKWDPHLGEFGGHAGGWVVTGGTGRFLGASGGGVTTATFLDKKAVEVLIELDGVIELP
jgi:hypothetical protein